VFWGAVLAIRFAESQLWGNSFGKELWGTTLGSSGGEQLWTTFRTSFEAASGSLEQRQFWGGVLENNFEKLLLNPSSNFSYEMGRTWATI
jgi:hypothetical protein